MNAREGAVFGVRRLDAAFFVRQLCISHDGC
jgi:hypothetical protein